MVGSPLLFDEAVRRWSEHVGVSSAACLRRRSELAGVLRLSVGEPRLGATSTLFLLMLDGQVERAHALRRVGRSAAARAASHGSPWLVAAVERGGLLVGVLAGAPG